MTRRPRFLVVLIAVALAVLVPLVPANARKWQHRPYSGHGASPSPSPSPTPTSSPSPTGSPTATSSPAATTASTPSPTASTLSSPTATATTSPSSSTSPTAGTTSTAASSGPITITAGGTYTGTYTSTDPSRPAVTIATSEPVVLSHATIRHTGDGVFAQSTRANLTVVDSTFTALAPPQVTEQLDVYAYQPASLVIEHNSFTDGHGITINGNNLTTSPFSISYNDFTDVGRYDATQMVGPVHTDKVLAPGGTIAWNRSTATYGQSVIEDAFGIYMTNGASGNPLRISHNLVNGAYPHSGNGSGFTGGAFDFGDGGGSWIYGSDNVAVNYTNNGFMVPSGHDIQHVNSVAVYDGHAGFSDTGPVVSSTFGNGATTWHNPSYPASSRITVSGLKVAHSRYNGGWQRADYNLEVCDLGCGSNTSPATVDGAAEKAAVDAYEASVTAAGVHIGPR